MHHSTRASRTLPPPARVGTAATPARLQSTILALLRRIDAVDIYRYVSSGEPTTGAESTVRVIASDTRALLDDLAAWYDAASTAALHPISDTATLGRMELNGHQEALASGQGPSWQRLAACEGALLVCRRCLRELERQVSETEGFPRAPDPAAGETALALELRRAYVELQRTVVGRAAPDPSNVVARLRASGNAIARVLGCPAVRAMRVDNIHMLQASLARIRAALLEAPRAATGLDPLLRLWQDLNSLASLLLDASKRDELRAHDLAAIDRALADTEQVPGDDPPPVAVLHNLRACEGRDGELDLLVAAGCSTSALRGRLACVRDALAPPPQRPSQRCSGTWSGVL
jgi:hypothetical protein